MVFRGEHEVVHAGGLARWHTGGVEVDGIQGVGHLAVFGDGDVEALHDPFGFVARRDVQAFLFAGEERVGSPVDEHAELVVAEPVEFGVGLGGGLGGEGEGEEQGGEGEAGERTGRRLLGAGWKVGNVSSVTSFYIVVGGAGGG